MSVGSDVRRCGGGTVTVGSHGQAFYTKYNPCKSPFQDERYGVGMRLHTPQQGKNLGKFRCTVCGMGAGHLRP